MHAGATCALLPKKHQAAWHRPDDTKRSTGLDGSCAYNPKRQNEWKIDNNAEYRNRGTGYKMGGKSKDWNQSVMVEKLNRFPERRMERQNSAFQSVPQYYYNFRAEVLPKAEVKGAPRHDKFHMDMTTGAASLRLSTNNFIGMQEKDLSAVHQKLSNTMRGEMPIHPRLTTKHNIWNQGEDDWNVSTQVLPKERKAAFDRQEVASRRTSSLSKTRLLNSGGTGYNYTSPQEIEEKRIAHLRALKTERRKGGKDFDMTWVRDGLRHTYHRFDAPSSAPAAPEREEEWDGEITFAKKRPNGDRTRARWNYASPC